MIVGAGGVNAAGRSSSHRAYQRLVADALPRQTRRSMWAQLATMMGLEAADEESARRGTLVRRIERFDADGEVGAAGQLPSGFEPGALYPSRQHPRGLEMAVFAASDLLGSMGLPWETIQRKVAPEQISVYAGSGMSQLDAKGFGGMLQASLLGRRVSAKCCPLGFPEMPADFINAYVLDNLGGSGAMTGACASFLYNLRLGVMDIRTGAAQVAIVGASEAPICPEIIDGYAAMNALATDAGLRALDNLAAGDELDYSRASRPFAENCGFVIGESAQLLALMDDALALELGAQVLGAVPEVFVNADGGKKSISGPGAGNYLTMARACDCVRTMLGDESLRRRSFVMAHGTGTPQNRATESRILDRMAEWFGIEEWPVAAVKAQLGHSIASAAGDQITAALGVWAHGLIPGIATLDKPAADVSARRLALSGEHREVGVDGMDSALINSKGFGGNNASAALLSPGRVERMLERRHGVGAVDEWRRRAESSRARAEEWDREAAAGRWDIRYRFGDSIVDGEAIEAAEDMGSLRLPDGRGELRLNYANPYEDMC